MELSRQSVLQLFTALLLLSHQSEGQCSSTNNLTANSFEKRFVYTSPSRFRNNITCSWLIRTTGDKSLNMKVMVNIMRSENCKDGYLDLYEGLGNNGNLISRMCGTRNIRLSGHGRYIYVYLHSSSFGPGSFLNLTYLSVDRVLLKTKVYTLTSEEAITKQLTSPYYPEVYLNKMKYLYIIMASDKNYFVRLHVSELITWCPHDMLSIYDGASETGRKTGSLCGNRKDITKVSSGRKMLLVFQTDGSRVAKGFQASYISYLKGNICDQSVTVVAKNNKMGFISSPNYPHKFPHGVDCVWIIQVPINLPILITILDIDIPKSVGCINDSLQVYKGTNINGNVLFTRCGSQTIIFKMTGTVAIVLHSDAIYSGRGFLITYRVGSSPANKSCSTPKSVEATGYWNILTSPYYPIIYEPNLQCVWLVRAQYANQLVQVEVLDLVLEEHANCSYDSLRILEGGSGTVLKRLCDNTRSLILSAGNSLRIEFSTDANIEYRGFRLRYRLLKKDLVCPSTKSLEAGPKYRNISSCDNKAKVRFYMGNTCTWEIKTGTDSRSTVVVVSWELGNETCDQTFLEITVDDNVKYECGSGIEMYSGRYVRISYHRTLDSPTQGFTALYWSVTEPVHGNRSVVGVMAAIAAGFSFAGFGLGLLVMWFARRRTFRRPPGVVNPVFVTTPFQERISPPSTVPIPSSFQQDEAANCQSGANEEYRIYQCLQEF